MFLWLQSLCFSSVETSKNFPILKDCCALPCWPSFIKDCFFSFCQPHQALHWKHLRIRLRDKAFKYKTGIICSNTQKCHHTHTHTHKKNRNVGMDVKLYPWGLIQSPFLSRLGKPSHNGREHNPLPTCGCVLWPSSQACCIAHVRAKPLSFISDPNCLRDFLVSFDFLCKIWYDVYAGIHILI